MCSKCLKKDKVIGELRSVIKAEHKRYKGLSKIIKFYMATVGSGDSVEIKRWTDLICDFFRITRGSLTNYRRWIKERQVRQEIDVSLLCPDDSGFMCPTYKKSIIARQVLQKLTGQLE